MILALLGSVLFFVLWLLIPAAIVVLLLYVRVRFRLKRGRAGSAQRRTGGQGGGYIEGEFVDEPGDHPVDDEDQQTP